MSIRLRWLGATANPVDGAPLRPDLLAGRALGELARMPLRVGNRSVELGELFEVEPGPGEPDRLEIEGDLSGVGDLARGMSGGQLVIRGNVGPRLGVGMTGGVMEVEGQVGPWAGAEMAGGLLRIKGGAAEFLGGARPGSPTGMRDGMIFVEGSVGAEAGHAMRRGLIAVAGPIGPGAGHGMIAGTILGIGPVGRPLGVRMKRGSIVARDPAGGRVEVFPTFVPAGVFRPTWLEIYVRRLRDRGFPVPRGWSEGPWMRWNGDVACGGQGEVLTGL